MRGLLVAAILFLSCGFRTPLDDMQTSDGRTPSPMGDAATADRALADTSAVAEGGGGHADREIPADTALDGDGPATCSPLPVTWLPEPGLPACPASSASAACAANDVGVVVARSAACILAWGNVPFQCLMWPLPEANHEFVVLVVPDCEYSVSIETALACDDHIEIHYVIQATCTECKGERSTMRAFSLPLDARPVIATGRIDVHSCIL